MPRRWFQLRLATLMALVTLSAIGVDFCRRRSQLLQFADLQAAEAERREVSARMKMTDWWFSAGSRIPTADEWAEYQERDRQLAIHHQALAARYRRSAWFPWFVEPKEDPPRAFFLDALRHEKPPVRRSWFTLK